MNSAQVIENDDKLSIQDIESTEFDVKIQESKKVETSN